MQENNASDSSRSPSKNTHTIRNPQRFSYPIPLQLFSTRAILTPKTQVSSSPRPESLSNDLNYLLRDSIPCVVCEQPPDAIVWTGTMTEVAGQINKKLEEGFIPLL